ncbi:MAG: CAP domain-containing protein [Rhodomicrobium sp.]
MERTIRIVLICAALGGCASAGGLPSFSSIGGASEPDKPATAAAATAPDSAQSQSGSSLSGIWKNFSSAFTSGAQPVSQKPGENIAARALDANEALRLINDYRASKHLAPLSLDPLATAAAENLVKEMAKHDRMLTNGQDLGKRLLAAGYSYGLAAENASVGQASITETVEGWKKTPANSRNMLLPKAKHIGIAYEYKADTTHKTFWALVVAAP